jgi:hypothetical protein
MASDEERKTLTLIVGGANDFTEEQLNSIIDANSEDVDAQAAVVWEVRAGKYHGLVNVSESGSSRQLSDMHKNALAMASYYRNKGVELPGTVPTGRTRVGRIVRA